MRKLTHCADDKRAEGRGMSVLVPIITGAVIMGCALTMPARGVAEPAGSSAPCSASVERGTFSSHTSTTAASRLMRTPLLESNKYLQISMPNAYVEQVSQAAGARPESERQAFKADAFQRNIPAALAALGTNRSAAFECVPPASPAAAPAAPQPSAAPAPEPSAPASAAPPPSAPQPAPAQDGGVAGEPAPRSRVIRP